MLAHERGQEGQRHRPADGRVRLARRRRGARRCGLRLGVHELRLGDLRSVDLLRLGLVGTLLRRLRLRRRLLDTCPRVAVAIAARLRGPSSRSLGLGQRRDGIGLGLVLRRRALSRAASSLL